MNETEPNQSSNYKLSMENMWSVSRGDTGNWGIEGYEVPRDYFDHLRSKSGKVLWEKLTSKKLVSNWPPKLSKDDNDKLIWPKRPNFIEEIKKWAGSYYNKEKSEKTIEELSNKNKDWDKPPKPKTISKNLQGFHLHGDRKTNIDWIMHNEKKKYKQYPDKEDKINEIKEKIEKERKEKKTEIQRIMEKFKLKGSLPKCQRATVVADAEHRGEKVPFCTDGKKKGEESDKGEEKKANKKGYMTAYPNILPSWNKDPIWTFNFYTKKDEEVLERKKEMDDERYRTFSEKHIERLKRKNLNIELSQTFTNMLHFRKIYPGFGKLTHLKEEEKEKHKRWTEERPKKKPGPQQYWKTIPYSKEKTSRSMNKSEPRYSVVENSDGSKSLMIDRKVTDKAVYKPLSSIIF